MKPEIHQLCLFGEQAFEDDEFEDAVEWYELACAGTMHEIGTLGFTLVERRFDRLAELRAMVPWRSVRRLAAPDPGHVLAVMTCAGREARCGKTMESLVEAGSGRWPGRRLLVDDGGTGPTGYGSSWRVWERFIHAPSRGQAATFFQALHFASCQIDFTALTLLEDDVVLTRNALDYIATTEIDDDLAFISWFSNETCTIPRTQPVLSCFKARDYQFNQAITFPARTVHKLLESDALKHWPEKHGADRIYKDVFPDQLVAVHYPNLVQHVGGTESLVGNNAHGPRTSPSFPGEDFDAWTLRRR